MEVVKLSPDDIGTIVSFVVPGYFAIRAYTLVHTKVERDFSKILIESIAFSLPIVGLYNALWRHFLLSKDKTLYTMSVKYSIPLLVISILIGYGCGLARKKGLISNIAKKLRLPGPNDDFIEVQFNKLKKNEYVTVTLRNGEIFSGVRAKISTYRKDEPQLCYFNYFSWYNEDESDWEDRQGSLIISMQDVHYIETPHRLSD
jgi:hypothetical protein